jgi:signal transduction histidine kinase
MGNCGSEKRLDKIILPILYRAHSGFLNKTAIIVLYRTVIYTSCNGSKDPCPPAFHCILLIDSSYSHYLKKLQWKVQLKHIALQQKIDDSKILIGKVIQDLRDLSKSLNTDYVKDMGLLQAVEYELEMIRKSGEYQTIINVNGLPFKAEAQKELIIFRIVQEIINNIIKHAKATEILFQADYHPTGIHLTITDNGAGFDLTPLNRTENGKFGLGLRNMNKRAQLIGATFTITSTIGVGTSVSIILPMQTVSAPSVANV